MKRYLVLGALLLVIAAAFLFGGPRSLVDWRPVRAVALESDDWGLAGFVPEAGAWEGLDRGALGTGRFPEVYWGSTLEDEGMVDGITGVLTSVLDADGLPALFQPNYVMGSLHQTESGDWVQIDLPGFPPAYARPGLWAAVARAREAGVWQPEFHAAYHYDPAQRMDAAVSSETAREVTRRGIMLFPGSEQARELGPARSFEDRRNEFDHALEVFRQVFGSGPEAIMAPDYTWDAAMERMWEDRGIRIIQGKREQRNPGLGYGKLGRVQKYLERRWDKVMRTGRVYLERNCRLEPVQSPDAGAVVADCLEQVRRAWESGYPAIVETHRVNFAHTDPGVVDRGRESLADFLGSLSADPDAGPRFLADRELASLMTRGTSWSLRGRDLVVRNGTHGRKIVLIPIAELEHWVEREENGDPESGFWLVPVGGMQVQKLDSTGAVTWRGQIR